MSTTEKRSSINPTSQVSQHGFKFRADGTMRWKMRIRNFRCLWLDPFSLSPFQYFNKGPFYCFSLSAVTLHFESSPNLFFMNFLFLQVQGENPCNIKNGKNTHFHFAQSEILRGATTFPLSTFFRIPQMQILLESQISGQYNVAWITHNFQYSQ